LRTSGAAASSKLTNNARSPRLHVALAADEESVVFAVPGTPVISTPEPR
jgi:hypothetical protein